GAGERASAIQVHGDRLCGVIRLSGVRRYSVAERDHRRGHHRLLRALHLHARAKTRSRRTRGDAATGLTAHDSERRAFFQFCSEVQTPRSSRKRSTGTEPPSDSTFSNCTFVHWKPHFSSTRRELVLTTRAPARISVQSNSSNV